MKAKTRQFYESDLFMALMVASLVALVFIAAMMYTSRQAGALEFPLPGNLTLHMAPADIHAYGDDSTPSDIQPALGYRALQGSNYSIQ